jgi:Flp pilus assembly protein TadB
MRFAAGITVTGIISLIVIEALKLLVPTLAVWLVAALTLILKVLAIGVVLMLVVGILGVGFFVYKRTQRHSVET